MSPASRARASYGAVTVAILRKRAGSAAADAQAERLEQLLATAERRGYAIARGLLGDAAEAEDAVQEALVRAWSAWSQLADPAALDAWFLRTLTNVCLSLLRRRRLWRTLWGWWPRRTAAPQENGPDAERLAVCLAELPARQQTALVLRYGQELSIEQIAQLLGVGAGTVKTHLRRGMERLRQRMGGRDDE